MTTFIFDFDGTLVDSIPAIVNAFNQQKNIKRKICAKDLAYLHNLTFLQSAKYLKLSILKTPLTLHKIKNTLYQNITSVVPFPHIIEALLKLKAANIKLGILTFNAKKNVITWLKHYNLEIFDFVHTESSLFKKTKNLSKLLKIYNLQPKNTIYIGDEIGDIKAAKKCGIKSAAVNWGLNNTKTLLKYAPDFIINNPKELLDII